MGYFFKLLKNPETDDKSQPVPITISAIFHPIPLSKTKMKAYKAKILIIMAILYSIRCNFLRFS